jgi:MFS family permease
MPAAIWALGFVSLLMDVSSELIHSLLPVFLVTSLGSTALAVGLIDGAAEAAGLIVKVFSGVLADYWRKNKPLAVVGYGLSALSKPIFALATSPAVVLVARVTDRIGKGIRGAPRDALIAEIAPPHLRGAAFGLRQSLDSVGAFLGPIFAMGLMLAWDNDFRAVFGVAVFPAALAVVILSVAAPEPRKRAKQRPANPIRREQLRRLSSSYWQVAAIGGLLALARFSEAFLVLRAQQGGLPIAFAPLVLIAMNAVYALAAYPFGKLADNISHVRLLALGLGVLLVADVALAHDGHWMWVWAGIALWGLHMGMTQGLLATMVADTAPADLRGTAYGFFNLISGLAALMASALAGLLWDWFGAPQTFLAGATFSAAALAAILVRGRGATPRP